MRTSVIPRLPKGSHRFAEIEHLGWAGGIAFSSHGARIGIRANDPAVLDRLAHHLPIGAKESLSPRVGYLLSLVIDDDHGGSGTGKPRDHRLYGGPELMIRTGDMSALFEGLESVLEFAVAMGAPRKLFVHAGVVGWHGRAIVIPGRSRSGKTSLVKALVCAGATYLSDEFAVFDARGRVHPFPRALNIRQEGKDRPRRCPVEDLGGRVGTRSLPVGLIAVTRYQSGARWQPRVLPPGEAMLALLDNTVLARTRPQFALATFGRVVSEAAAVVGKRGEVQTMVQSLLDGACRPDPTPLVRRELSLSRRAGHLIGESP